MNYFLLTTDYENKSVDGKLQTVLCNISVYSNIDDSIKIFVGNESDLITLFMEYYSLKLPTILSFWENTKDNLIKIQDTIRRYLEDQTFILFDEQSQTLIDYSVLYSERFCIKNKHFSYEISDILEDFFVIGKTKEDYKNNSLIEQFKFFDKTTNCIKRIVTMCKFCDSPIKNYKSVSKLFACLYKKYCKNIDLSSDYVDIAEEDDTLTGGYSFAIPGYYKNVIELDFNSFYPLIIKTLNISNEAITDSDSDVIKTFNDVKLNKKLGIIPKIVDDLIKLRKEVNEEDEMNYKILTNVIYGCFAYKNSPIYSVKLASAITSAAQNIIKSCISFVNKYLETKYNIKDAVIFCYTDSMFINKADKEFDNKEIVDILNKYIALYLKKNCNCNENYVNISCRETLTHFFVLNNSQHLGISSNGEFKVAGTDIRKTEYSIFQRNYMIQFIKFYIENNLDLEFTKKFVDNEKKTYLKSTNINMFCTKKKFSLQTQYMKNGIEVYNHFIQFFKLENKYSLLTEDEKLKYTFIDSTKLNDICFKSVLPRELKFYLDIDKVKCYNEFVCKPTINLLEQLERLKC